MLFFIVTVVVGAAILAELTEGWPIEHIVGLALLLLMFATCVHFLIY